MYPDSIHAIILCVGGVFPIDIMRRNSSSSSNGPMSPRPLFDIYNQLAQAMSHGSSTKQSNTHHTVICGLSALERKSWAAIREEILKQGDTAAESLGLMESAVVALSLEDCNAPPEMASILNTVRLGGGDGPCLRYYDKVINGVYAPMHYTHTEKHLLLLNTLFFFII